MCLLLRNGRKAKRRCAKQLQSRPDEWFLSADMTLRRFVLCKSVKVTLYDPNYWEFQLVFEVKQILPFPYALCDISGIFFLIDCGSHPCEAKLSEHWEGTLKVQTLLARMSHSVTSATPNALRRNWLGMESLRYVNSDGDQSSVEPGCRQLAGQHGSLKQNEC